jgi:hypothetical protein
VEDVDPSGLADDLGDHPRAALRIKQVRHLAQSTLTQFFGQPRQGDLILVHHDNRCAFVQQGLGRCQADAGSSTGHGGYLPLERSCHR